MLVNANTTVHCLFM